MKTPRQRLLEEHAPADARLERLQARAIAQGLAQTKAGPAPKLRSVIALLWAELFVPARRIWTGFGVAWLVIAAVNIGGADSPRPTANAKPPTAAMILAWKEQQRLAFDLANRFDMQPAEPAKAPEKPAPRSQRQSTIEIG